MAHKTISDSNSVNQKNIISLGCVLKFQSMYHVCMYECVHNIFVYVYFRCEAL